ncbi:hypothetical protein SAMD00019534_103160 [Acytostelium subglobosum LB1]|uniref:hypothetical protein n=1 Tax=Acytostelium subglobosum LB1 TaxID=1410327 RepID=UPI000645076C|nr:hypothetical protein SAMD00019534_103160 [Acytostelium subglobosum LB1]GAM27141.1 hypothetical protein SAMD00019534_103160 [Acytostelium subglobosum LB1]|eukprot:XP_012750021.1 hypothetical protein SAMD00019534_103160 [Acytostelium subglobosum LB1]
MSHFNLSLSTRSKKMSKSWNCNSTKSWRTQFRKQFEVERNWKQGRYQVSTEDGHNCGVFTLAFKEHILLTGSFEKNVRIWDRKNMIKVGSIAGHQGWVWKVLLEQSSASHELISMSASQDACIHVTNLSQTNAKLANNHHYVVGENSPSSYSATIKSKPIQPSTRLIGHKGTVWTIDADKDLRTVYSGSSDYFVKRWDIETQKSCNIGKHHDVVLCLTRGSSGNHFVVSGSADRTVKLWDIRSSHHNGARMSLSGNTGCINSVAFKGNLIVAGGDDKVVRVYDVRNGQCINVVQGHNEAIRVLRIKGNRMVTGSSDKTIKVWNMDNLEHPVNTLRGHTGSVVSLQFDHKKIISGSLDSTIKKWSFDLLSCPKGGVGASPNKVPISRQTRPSRDRTWNNKQAPFQSPTPFRLNE